MRLHLPFLKLIFLSIFLLPMAISAQAQECALTSLECPDLVSKGSAAQVHVAYLDCHNAKVCSSKDISNVVIDFAPKGKSDNDLKYDNLSGYTFLVTETEEIIGIWVKSGNNKSGDCPGCGEYVKNDNYGSCDSYTSDTPVSVDCPKLSSVKCRPEVHVAFKDCYNAKVCSAKDLSNLVLDFAPQGFGPEDYKYDGLSGKSKDITETKIVLGIWVKSGCNQSVDCPGCGEYIANTNLKNCNSTCVMDYGDLPSEYPVIRAFDLPDNNGDGKPDGKNAVWLGNMVDYEQSMSYVMEATGDGTDDDGLKIKKKATSSDRNEIWEITVNRNDNAKKVFFQINIDWDHNGSLETYHSGVIAGTSSRSASSVDVNVPVPYYYNGGPIYVRVVAADNRGAASRISGSITNGEIEDYMFAARSILPVDFLSFEAIPQSASVSVIWSTANEINNDGFEVQRSNDGKNYETLGIVVAGKEASNEYLYMDDNPATGKNYYRLKQMDTDGQVSYSSIRIVHWTSSSSNDKISFYPNPVRDVLFIKDKGLDGAEVSILDMNGKVVLTSKYANNQPISVATIAPGVYNLRVTASDKQVFTKRLLKVK